MTRVKKKTDFQEKPQIKQKNPRSSEKKQQWQHCLLTLLSIRITVRLTLLWSTLQRPANFLTIDAEFFSEKIQADHHFYMKFLQWRFLTENQSFSFLNCSFEHINHDGHAALIAVAYIFLLSFKMQACIDRPLVALTIGQISPPICWCFGLRSMFDYV